jgi:signal transduction histidine kinase
MVGGRDLEISLMFGVANAAEAWLVPFMLTRAGRLHPELTSLTTAYRLCVSVAAGAILMGFLAGVAIQFSDGDALLPTWIGVSAAHATAVLIIVPFALVPRDHLARVSRLEIAIQIIALVATLLYVFGPGRLLPLSFLPLPVVAWAAFRFPTRVVLFEIVILALEVSFLTGYGGGPFDQAVKLGGNPSTLVQIFLLSITSFALLATSSQNGNRAVTTRLADREEILRGGFVSSRVGLLIVERYRQGFVVLESNNIASAVIEEESNTVTDEDGESAKLWDGPLATMIQVKARQRINKFSWQTNIAGVRSDVEVLIAALGSSFGTRYSIQFVDVSVARRTAEAQQLALEKEQVATGRLTELNRQKEEFVASASHELRTPITSILGYVELLEEEELDEIQRTSVETIARNARRLADLVENLLELGRPLDPSTTMAVSDGTRVATEVIQNLEPLAERGDVSLTIELGAPLLVAVPAIDLDRILTNLVNNAIKFTPRGGSVRLTLEETDTSAVLTVTDTGVGMSEDVMNHIFERFYRAPDAEARGITGTGLGLPLVHGLVMKHYGTVDVESTPGTGSIFTVTLPLSNVPILAAQQ